MNTLDYKAEAALYLGSDWQTALDQGARTFSSAAKAIRKLPTDVRAPILAKIGTLASDPRPLNSVKLTDQHASYVIFVMNTTGSIFR